MLRRLVLFALCTTPLATSLAQTKPVLTRDDLGKWESLGASRLAPNGAWLAYAVTRGNEENELRLRGSLRDSTTAIPYATGAAFSPDSRWLAYLVGVSPTERDQRLKDKKPVRTSFALRNLASGQTVAISDVQSFNFNRSGGFVSVSKYSAEGKKTNDVIVIELATSTRWSFSNVQEHAWSEAKPLLAVSVTTEGSAGNSVQLFDGSNATTRVLESSANLYRAVSWRPKSTDLAVLRSDVQKDFVDTAHVVLAWADAGSPASKPRTLDAAVASGFPAANRITDYRRPSWSRDGRILYFGVKKRETIAAAIKKGSEKVSDVEIWHTNDIRLIPEQRSDEQRDLRSTVLAAWHIADGRVVPIGSDAAQRHHGAGR